MRNHLTTRNMQHVMLLLIAIICGVVTGVTFVEKDSKGVPLDEDGLLLALPPDSLETLVGNSNIIAVGTVESYIGQNWFAGYDDSGKLIKAKDSNLPPEAEVPFYDYTLRLDKVIASDSGIQDSQTVTLRMFVSGLGQNSSQSAEYPPSMPGDKYLFFLKRNPDHATYGLKYGPASRLTIDGPITTFSDGKRTPVTFVTEPLPEHVTNAPVVVEDKVIRQPPPVFIEEVRKLVETKRPNNLR